MRECLRFLRDLVTVVFMLVVFPVTSRAVDVELAYDSDDPSSCYPIGYVAVRFTPPEGSWRLKTFKYLSCQNTDVDVRLRILAEEGEKPGQDIYSGTTIDQTSAGWNEVDIESHHLWVEGDFYAGLECIEVESYVDIALGGFPGNERSWVYDISQQWEFKKDYTFYFRMVVTNEAGIEEETVPADGSILFCRPHTFTTSITISYNLPESGLVRVNVWDSSGRYVRNLARGYRSAGRFTVEWDGTGDHGDPLPAGLYFINMTHSQATQTRVIVFLP